MIKFSETFLVLGFNFRDGYCPNDNLYDITSGDPVYCQNVCRNDPSCKGFVYFYGGADEGLCKLKTASCSDEDIVLDVNALMFDLTGSVHTEQKSVNKKPQLYFLFVHYIKPLWVYPSTIWHWLFKNPNLFWQNNKKKQYYALDLPRIRNTDLLVLIHEFYH